MMERMLHRWLMGVMVFPTRGSWGQFWVKLWSAPGRRAAADQAVQSQKSATRSPSLRVGIQRAGMAAPWSPSTAILANSPRVFR